ncbi:DNA repair protein RecO [bacterium]|nr:DNA repair protein RecO [bacterium]
MVLVAQALFYLELFIVFLMTELCKTRALVVSRSSLGESDELIRLFTPGYGLLKAAVRGSKKVTSSWVGRLEPFSELDVWLRLGKGLGRLEQAEYLCSFAGIRTDYTRLCWGSYLLELWAAVFEDTADAADADEGYALLRQALDALNRSERFRLGCCWAEWRLLSLLGHKPCADSCVECGERSLAGFSYALGGTVCARHLAEPACRLSSRLLKMLYRLRFLTAEKAISVTADPAELKSLEDVVWKHWCACDLPRVRARRMVDNLE